MSGGPVRTRDRRMYSDRDKSRDPYDRRDAPPPRERAAAKEDDRDMADDYERGPRNSIKVSATSNVKQVAGKIAHSAREGEPPAILTIGATCINQAVKSIAIARGYLENDNWDVSFQPAFRDRDRTKASIALYIAKQKPLKKPREEEEELLVKANSQPTVVAGALAARIREGKSVCLTSIGVDAVTNAVLAVGNARLYLEQDNLDIRALPEFIHVKKNDIELSAVKFNIVAEPI